MTRKFTPPPLESEIVCNLASSEELFKLILKYLEKENSPQPNKKLWSRLELAQVPLMGHVLVVGMLSR